MLELPSGTSINQFGSAFGREFHIRWVHNLAQLTGGQLTLEATRKLLTHTTTSKHTDPPDYHRYRNISRALDFTCELSTHTDKTEQALRTIHLALLPDPDPPDLTTLRAWRTTEQNHTRHTPGDDLPFPSPERLPELCTAIVNHIDSLPRYCDTATGFRAFTALHNALSRVSPFELTDPAYPLIVANIPLIRARHAPIIPDGALADHYTALHDDLLDHAGCPQIPDDLWIETLQTDAVQTLFAQSTLVTDLVVRAAQSHAQATSRPRTR